MLQTTDAIVLALQPQSDKAHLLHAYTRAGGRTNYKVYGLGKHHSAGLYMPFSLVRITADYPPAASAKLPSVREVVPIGNGQSVTGNQIYKQTVRLFVSEVLFRTLRHPMPDEQLFDFLAAAVNHMTSLDEDDQEEIANFHIVFLVSLAAQLGFAIDDNRHPELLCLPQTRTERQRQLLLLCNYFAEHIDTWQHPKSLDVLTEIFN